MVTTQPLSGDWQQIKAQLQEHWAQLTSHALESSRGSVEELLKTIQLITGEARDTIQPYLEKLLAANAELLRQSAAKACSEAEQLRQRAERAASQAADSVQAGYVQTGRLVRRHPLESLALSFATGIAAGLAASLLLRSK